MSSIKLKFYKTAPNLFISKLRPIAREYNEERVYTFGFDEPKTTVLEEILPEVASERFFNVLYKELNCRLNFGSEYTPDSIKRNQKIVDLAIKHDPGAALDMLDEMLTEEHLRILEEHLSSDGRVFTYITKIPAKFTKSEIILDYYLKQVFENDHRMQVVDRDIFEIIRAYLNEPYKVKKILNRTEEYYKTHDAYLTATRAYGFDRIFENQDVLEFFLKRNNLYLEYLSGPTLDRGLKIIADKIIDGTFDYGAYNAPYFNVLYDSNIIINAILKTNQIEKYKIILARSNVTSFNYIQLTKLFEYNLTAPELLFPDEWEKSTDFLHIYLTNPELRPKNIRFNQFKKEAFII